MKKKLTLLLVLMLQIVVAQKKVTIKVVDALKSVAITDADAYNSTSQISTKSNEGGFLQVSGNPDDLIIISALWYSNKEITFAELEKSKTIQLQPNNQNLEAVTIVANKRQNVGIQHIDKLSLKLLPINNAQDLLKTVSGLFIAQHAGGGKAEQIFLRGFDNDHGTDFGVFIDDIPVNLSSHAHGQGYADMHFLIPEIIDDADYYKGPYEMKNGNFVVSGAARFKTKNEISKNTIKFDIGQYGYQRGLSLINLTPNYNLFSKKSNENAYVAIEGTLNKSFFDAPQDFKKFSGFFKYNAQLSDNTSLTALTSYFTSKWNASGQIPLRAVNNGQIGWFGAIDNTEGGATARLNASLKISSLLKNNQHITNLVYYVNNEYQLLSNFTFYLNDPINGDMVEQTESRNILGYHFEYDRKDKIGKTKIKTTLSAGFKTDWIHSRLFNNKHRKRLALHDENQVTETNYWAYFKEDWKLNSKWLLQFGSRLDYFRFNVANKINTNDSGTRDAFRISPKASLFYNPTHKIQFFAKAGSGFHSNYSHAAIGDRSIHPLPKAIATDLGSEFKIGDNIIGTVTLWTIKSDAEYIFVADAGEFENNGNSFRKGIDIAGKIQPIKNTWFNLSANYSKGILLDEPDNANSIPSAPVFSATASIAYNKPNGIQCFLGSRYMAKRPLTEDESVFADSYFIVDASVNYPFKKFIFGLSAQNLFDVKWMEAVFYDTSRLPAEPSAGVDDLHFTPGTPLFLKASVTYNF